MRRGDFPPLRDTAAWEEAQEARRTKILAAVVVILFYGQSMTDTPLNSTYANSLDSHGTLRREPFRGSARARKGRARVDCDM